MQRILFASALALGACLDTAPPPPPGCLSCHGGAESAAPPGALGGFESRGYLGVGAHRVHLDGAGLGRAVACDECHLVPETVDAPGHIDTTWPAELVFGALARTASAAPSWDRASGTCANSYCHGATLPGGARIAPVWTSTDGAAKQCGACHGMPPPAPHPNDARCADCHAPTAGPGGIADPSTHINGRVETAGRDPCGGCHGVAGNLAPPPDRDGKTDRALRSVGAHAAHVSGGNASRPVACGDCHEIPATVGAPGHIDPAPAEVRFAGVARGGTWDGERCANTYCHGPASPAWTETDGASGRCGGCHAMPPPPPHPASMRCTGCHPMDRSTHVDGLVQR